MDGKPSSITRVDEGERLILERRWLNMTGIGVIAFAVIWNVFLIFYARQTLTAESSSEESILIIPLAIVGVVAGYLALANLLNRTRFTVDSEKLSVTQRPIPWRGKRVERVALQQIAVKQYSSGSNSRRQTTFAVLAVRKDGNQQRLIGDLKNAAEAVYIKQSIHQYLGIDPPPLEGEYRF